jgi:hypothetical protein
MAKITVTTDKAGRKVYKVAGTKKYAYSMAKAKEIAGKESGTAKRASRGRGSAEEGYYDTKGRRGVRVSKKKPSAAAAKKYAAFEAKLVSYVINDVKGGLTGYKKAHAAFKKDAYKAAAMRDINDDYVTPSFVRTVLRELKYEIDDLEGLRKEDRAIAAARKSGKLPALRGSGKTTKPKSAARKGTKKRSRQKTGRALYRSRRNPAFRPLTLAETRAVAATALYLMGNDAAWAKRTAARDVKTPGRIGSDIYLALREAELHRHYPLFEALNEHPELLPYGTFADTDSAFVWTPQD